MVTTFLKVVPLKKIYGRRIKWKEKMEGKK